MIEFAVFDPDELYLARVNQFRILLDRSDLAQLASDQAAEARPDRDERLRAWSNLGTLAHHHLC